MQHFNIHELNIININIINDISNSLHETRYLSVIKSLQFFIDIKLCMYEGKEKNKPLRIQSKHKSVVWTIM